MKNNWVTISILSALISGLTTFLLTMNWKLSILISGLIFLIVLANNPKRRYMKAFWVVLSMILILNKFFFQVIGEISEIHFKLGSNKIGSAVTISLIFLAGITLLLDYLERNGKLQGTFLEANKYSIGDVKGNNNSVKINIGNNKEITDD